MNPYETPLSAVAAPEPDLVERATRLREFRGKLCNAGAKVLLGAVILGYASGMIPGLSGLPVFAALGVVLGGVVVVANVIWEWVAIFLDFIGWTGRPRNLS